MEAQTFAKAERLHSKKLIQELFTKGSSFYLHPFKVLILIHPNQTALSHEILISVSKRNFKKAVDRNLIKRRIREVYRMEKHLLQNNSKLALAFIYSAKTILSLQEIKQGLVASLKRVDQRLPISREPNTPTA